MHTWKVPCQHPTLGKHGSSSFVSLASSNHVFDWWQGSVQQAAWLLLPCCAGEPFPRKAKRSILLAAPLAAAQAVICQLFRHAKSHMSSDHIHVALNDHQYCIPP